MSNAEGSSVPVPLPPRALLRVEALPVERHPAAVYLSSLGSGSRRTMRQSLGVIAEIVSKGFWGQSFVIGLFHSLADFFAQRV